MINLLKCGILCGLMLIVAVSEAGEAKFCSWYSSIVWKKDQFSCLNGEKCIRREQYCNSRDDCGDNSDEKYCNSKDCLGDQFQSCRDSKSKCIPKNWFCDCHDDCGDNSDENSSYCRNYTRTVSATEQSSIALRKINAWHRRQRNWQVGAVEMWGPNVDILALILYHAYSRYSIEMTNELTIRLLSRLLSMKLADIPTTELASYVNPFLVTCINPRNFYGHNIIQELRNRVDKENWTNPYVLLSLCNAGENITESDKKKLEETFESKHRTVNGTGMQAVVIMALACANKQSKSEVDYEKLRVLNLKLKQQYRNGAVDDLKTTALVMQALIAAGSKSDPDNFDEKKAFQEIILNQKPDGSFGDLMSTFLVTPVLACKSLADIDSNYCRAKRGDEPADGANNNNSVRWYESGLWLDCAENVKPPEKTPTGDATKIPETKFSNEADRSLVKIEEAKFCSWYSGLQLKDNGFCCLNGEKCIVRDVHCNVEINCGDSSDEKYCDTKECPEQFESCRGGWRNKCIPKDWFCDGRRDCDDGFDESTSYCQNYRSNMTEIMEQSWLAVDKVKRWIPYQGIPPPRGFLERWGSNADRLALILYHVSQEVDADMTNELTIQLQSRLLSKKLADIPTTELASYVNPFLVTCVNPRNFYGLDILQELRNRVHKENCTNPYVLLSLCNAGETITESDKKKLEETFESKHRTVNGAGVQAVVIMALACANKQSENEVDFKKLRVLTLKLKQKYGKETVVDLRTTALVMQALIAAGSESDPNNFDEKKAFQEMIRNQKSDGSFGDLMSTLLVTPVLTCKNFADIDSSHCKFKIGEGPADVMTDAKNDDSELWYRSSSLVDYGENIEDLHVTSTGNAIKMYLFAHLLSMTFASFLSLMY